MEARVQLYVNLFFLSKNKIIRGYVHLKMTENGVNGRLRGGHKRRHGMQVTVGDRGLQI
jgi:hypothetical protein